MEDSFYERLKEMFNDLLLTDKYNRGAEALALLNSNTYPARYWYNGISNNGLRNRLRDYANRAVAQEPLELIAHVVRENKPFTEVLTADYMMLNGFSANSYGLHETFNYPVGGDEYAEEYHKYRVYRMEGIPHAGILTTRAFLNPASQPQIPIVIGTALECFFNIFWQPTFWVLEKDPLTQLPRKHTIRP